ncbi:leader peptidase (prepilin peptidase)/N-methyltransferase [Desulfitobacterium sp. LBE]|uniref:Prepilin type IV endopeptidase peptidase domain-containing protein n=1 Tax=bioreactor metagenome TaxID=1076179 RepID=A0A644UAW8_9ZZZZ|nr:MULTISPECIES: A24 family peptidase [Desulfitobacterium]MEA5022215.1 A24 family peptidase [Desulfitobacterium hafniense]TWH59546.1 leader peptidase (prepilin peptidase)/N-methyltransferase [Desulfitobacterium sp. LBE]
MEIKLPLFLQSGFFTALLAAASFWDIRKRIIPDTLCLGIALTGLLVFQPANLWGIFVALPFLLAALIWGGTGGGDIKLMAAAGLVLGFNKSMAALIVGLSGLLLFHGALAIIQKLRGRTVPRTYPLAPFLTLGCLLAYFIH